jgi:hypothetical protein
MEHPTCRVIFSRTQATDPIIITFEKQADIHRLLFLCLKGKLMISIAY